MSFNQLPAEILELVFQNLDGLSFCLAQVVCKSWHEVLKKMQDDKRLWQKFCVKEIPDGVIEEILFYKSIPLQDLVLDWASIYRRWHQGKMVAGNNIIIKFIPAFYSNPVTCMKATEKLFISSVKRPSHWQEDVKDIVVYIDQGSRSWVITGHSNGFLCIWNQINGKMSQGHLCHLRTITDLALVDLLNLGSYYGSQELPWNHHHMITVSKDTCIKVKSLLEPIDCSQSDIVLNKHGDVLTSVRVFEKYFAVSCRDNTVTLWSLKPQKLPHLHLEISLLRTIIGPRDILKNLGFWHDKIYCISQAGKLNVYDAKRDEWLEQTYFKKCLSNVHEKRLIITAYYIFRNQTVIMLTASGKMIVSIDEMHHKTYNLMPTLQTLIVSVVLQGTVLALGGENGKLYLFHIPNNKSLLDIDLSRPTFQTTLSEASIVSIDILYDYHSPIIVACTTECLFIIKWYRKKNQKEIQRKDMSNYFEEPFLMK